MTNFIKSEVIRFWFYQPKVQRVFGAALIIGVVAAVAWVFWLPVHQEVSKHKEEINILRKQVVDTIYAKDIARVYEQSKKEVSIVENKLAVSVHQAELVKNLARLGGKRRVQNSVRNL